MSWTTAYELVRRHCLPTAKYDSWVSSRDELQAKLFIDELQKIRRNTRRRRFRGVGRLARGRLRFALAGVFERHADMVAVVEPRRAGGKRGARVLDEFALHPDPERLYAVAYPGITWGGSLQIISTHRGAKISSAGLVDEAQVRQAARENFSSTA